MVWRLIGIWAALASLAGLLATAQAASAANPPITCAGLAAAINSAGDGDVLQLEPGHCATNLNVTNTHAFTLEGAPGGGTVLHPAIGQPIVESSDDVRFTLRNLTFTGSEGPSAITLLGADQAVTITHDMFTDNVANQGAAININSMESSTTTARTRITDNTFERNSAANIAGAVAVLTTVPVTISGNTFIDNRSMFSAGAVLLSTRGSSTNADEVTGNTFTGNRTQGQGGALVARLVHGQTLALSSNTFQGNLISGTHTATAGIPRFGGAVYLSKVFEELPFTTRQSHNAFIGNLIDETVTEPPPAEKVAAGGAAEWVLGVTVDSTGDRFTDNRVAVNDGQPPEGGALGAFAIAAEPEVAAQPGVFTGSDDLFAHNSTAAGGWGGAIYVGGPKVCTGVCPASSITLKDSTVTANRVDAGPDSEGGAIWGSAIDHLTLHNSIVSGNTPKPELFGFGSSPPAIRFSDVCKQTGGPPVPGGAGNICADPKLSGSAKETALSPTLDAGSNALVPAGLTTDLAGKKRIRSCGLKPPAIVDMGAFEFQTVGDGPKCLDRTKPVVGIGPGPLKIKNGRVSVKLTCPRGQSFCDGTVRLDRAKRPLLLGKTHFHIAGGRTATVRVKLAKKALRMLGTAKKVRIMIATSARDRAGRTGTSKRTVTLRLRNA